MSLPETINGPNTRLLVVFEGTSSNIWSSPASTYIRHAQKEECDSRPPVGVPPILQGLQRPNQASSATACGTTAAATTTTAAASGELGEAGLNHLFHLRRKKDCHRQLQIGSCSSLGIPQISNSTWGMLPMLIYVISFKAYAAVCALAYVSTASCVCAFRGSACARSLLTQAYLASTTLIWQVHCQKMSKEGGLSEAHMDLRGKTDGHPGISWISWESQTRRLTGPGGIHNSLFRFCDPYLLAIHLLTHRGDHLLLVANATSLLNSFASQFHGRRPNSTTSTTYCHILAMASNLPAMASTLIPLPSPFHTKLGPPTGWLDGFPHLQNGLDVRGAGALLQRRAVPTGRNQRIWTAMRKSQRFHLSVLKQLFI